MAKLKIRKLVKDQQSLQNNVDVLQNKLQETVTMLGLLIHKSNGEITFTKEELLSLPEADFIVNKHEDTFTLKLKYKEE